MKRVLMAGAVLIGAAAIASALGVPPTGHTSGGVEPPPILVELFTSEGCSSCPPADRLLQQVDGKQTRNGGRIIGISEHVTYWDHLGWKDRFSSTVATQRQNAYGDRFHLDSVYTPQMIVNGRAQMVGSDAASVVAAIERQGAEAATAHLHIARVDLGAEGLTLYLVIDGLAKDKADLYVVVAQDMASTPVQRGENSGRTLTHVSIARSLSRVGVAEGSSEMTVHLSAAELKSSEGQKRHAVVFAQSRETGPVLAVDSIASSDPAKGISTRMQSDAVVDGYTRHWWKEAVVYQIYPRSFQDLNGDGIGDLPGITSRLNYLQDLGVDVLWLSPHYDSPNVDNGYDVRNYRKVMAEFGTMQDFDDLLSGVKALGMRLIVDLVVNHTSNEHEWFVQSRKSKDNPYRDYYIWRPGKTGPDGELLPPNNFMSAFSGSAWTLNPLTNEYYLHLFAEQQPDLDWDNSTVRDEVYDIMRFWLDKGVDGFRMDVIPFISKDADFPDVGPGESQVRINANGPHLHEYLREMNDRVLAHYDCMTVGEAHGISIEEMSQLIDERRRELDMIFNFDTVRLNRDGRNWRLWSLPELKAIYTRQDCALGVHSWNTIFLANHDNPRLVSAFGDDSPKFRVLSAKLLATMLLTLKGTPYLYQGDEIGMTNYPFDNINEYNDVEAKNAWQHDVESGHESAEHYLANLARVSRDHARTPMQWDDSPNAGFTTPEAKPWLAVNPNYKENNAAAALADTRSIYHHTQQLLTLRKSSLAFIYGAYEDLAPDHPHLFLYTRTLGEESFLVALNFSRETITVEWPRRFDDAGCVLSNDDATGPQAELHAWGARILRV